MHVTHPLLRPSAVEFRGYQANLARIAQREDTLVVLPTGMGKTVVALLVIADALKDGAQRILILAPTRPLVDQHGAFLKAALAEPWSDRVRAVTGNVSPEKRKADQKEPGILVATPQVVHNDLVSGGLDLASFDLVIFDEAHRASGDYPYVSIGNQFQQKAPKCRRLGLTASPGHDVRKIDEVRSALGLAHVEIRTPADADVAPYVQEIALEWETLPLPPTMARVSAKLNEALAERIRTLKGMGLLKTAGSRPNRRELLELQGRLQHLIQSQPNPDSSLFAALTLQAQAMKLAHAIEQVETQGSAAFVDYLEGVRSDANGPKPSKASRSLIDDARVNEAYHVARFDDAENPKMGRTGVLVHEALEADPDGRIMVFTHYRTTCEQVVTELAKLPGVKPVMFVGQGKRGGQDGLTQKQQGETIAAFKQGTHNVLVATSVAEEGLDIPEVDLVVFYEPIASEIRSIQRRGRTGRKRAGRVVVLMTKGTQDEAAHWASRRKEQQMIREMHGLRAQLGARPPPAPALPGGQTTLGAGDPGKRKAPGPHDAKRTAHGTPGEEATVAASGFGAPRIIFDHREQAGGVVRHLMELGAKLEGRQLEVADFVLSDRVAVERKTCADFVDSLVDGRLFNQLKELQAYPRPFLILEGESIYGHRNVSAEALNGALAAITIDQGIPVLQTRDTLETARFLHAVAKREQFRENRKIAVRVGKPMTDLDRQVFLLSGLPGVSEILAKRLLERFGSVSAALNASVADLAEVEALGAAKASEIRRILDTEYRARLAATGPLR